MKSAIMQTKTLLISAGHGDTDPGAVGNGHSEADIVTEFRDLVAGALNDKVRYAMDGTLGENLPLRNAIEMAKHHDVAVEFHCNAFHTPAATGVETMSAPKNMKLGASLCEVISKTLSIVNRGAKSEGSGQHSRLGFVSTGGGVIVELFFISNPDDLAAYMKHKEALAKAVADVLIDEVAPPRGIL